MRQSYLTQLGLTHFERTSTNPRVKVGDAHPTISLIILLLGGVYASGGMEIEEATGNR